jgi:hypothetical protein
MYFLFCKALLDNVWWHCVHSIHNLPKTLHGRGGSGKRLHYFYHFFRIWHRHIFAINIWS